MKQDGLHCIDPATRERFKTIKHRSQDRIPREELLHDEFLNMLLDVWELHERDHGTPAVEENTPDEGDIGRVA